MSKKKVMFHLLFQALIFLVLITLLAGMYNSERRITKRQKETLQWIAEKYAILEKTNCILINQNEYLERYSFAFVMNTLVTKCIKRKIPINIALALIQIESNFQPDVVSSTDDYGLFQINKIWEKELKIKITELKDPEINIETGLVILEDCYKKAGSWGLALALYNAGKYYEKSEHPKKLSESTFMK